MKLASWTEKGGGGMFGELLILRLFLQPSAMSRIDLSSEKFKREIAGMLQTIYFAVAIRAFTKGIPSVKERSSPQDFLPNFFILIIFIEGIDVNVFMI